MHDSHLWVCLYFSNGLLEAPSNVDSQFMFHGIWLESYWLNPFCRSIWLLLIICASELVSYCFLMENMPLEESIRKFFYAWLGASTFWLWSYGLLESVLWELVDCESGPGPWPLRYPDVTLLDLMVNRTEVQVYVSRTPVRFWMLLLPYNNTLIWCNRQ
jgi:hypothetical protein